MNGHQITIHRLSFTLVHNVDGALPFGISTYRGPRVAVPLSHSSAKERGGQLVSIGNKKAGERAGTSPCEIHSALLRAVSIRAVKMLQRETGHRMLRCCSRGIIRLKKTLTRLRNDPCFNLPPRLQPQPRFYDRPLMDFPCVQAG